MTNTGGVPCGSQDAYLPIHADSAGYKNLYLTYNLPVWNGTIGTVGILCGDFSHSEDYSVTYTSNSWADDNSQHTGTFNNTMSNVQLVDKGDITLHCILDYTVGIMTYNWDP